MTGNPTNGAIAPPHDLDAEAAVLSAIILAADVTFPKILDIVRPSDFYSTPNRRIAEAAWQLRNEGSGIDVVTIARRLNQEDRLQQVGGSPYLSLLTDSTPAFANVDDHARIVRERAKARRIADGAQVIAAEAKTGTPVEALVTRLRELAEDTDVAPRTSPWPVVDIFARLEPISYIIEAIDLCPGAPAMWAGYGFSAKTVSAQAAAIVVASTKAGEHGRVWDCFAAPKGKVLHLDYEQGSRLTRERYQRLAATRMLTPDEVAPWLTLVCMPSVYLDEPRAEAELAKLVDGYQLVIVDSFRAATPTLDENSSDIRRVLDMMSRVSERTRCTFLVIHHARKPKQDAPGGAKMAIRGSGALFDACSSVLVFEAEKGKPTRVSQEKARTSGVLAADFLLTVSDVEVDGQARGGLLVTAEAAPSKDQSDDDAAKTKQLARQARVEGDLRALFDREPEQTSADAMARKIGRKALDVRRALAALIEAGAVLVEGEKAQRRYLASGRKQ